MNAETEDDDDKPKSKKKKDKDSESKRPKTASISTDDDELAKWIFDLTAKGEVVQKIECVQLLQGGRVLGTCVHTEPVKTKAFTAASAAELANTILGHAQRNCTRVVKRRQSYGVRAHDVGKAADVYREYPLDLRPRSESLATQGQLLEDGVDEDELVTDGKKLSFLQLKDARAGAQHMFAAAATMSGETYLLMRAQIDQLMDFNAQLNAQLATAQNTIASLHAQMNEMADHNLDRELAREDKKLWIEIKREGWKQGKSALMSIFGPNGSGAPQNVAGKVIYPDSKERNLIETFLEDCIKEKIDGILFGDWSTDEKGVMRCLKEGIFKPSQFAILMGVQHRELPVEALDDLLPESGKPDAVTIPQMQEAQKHVSDGIGAPFMMVINLRREARAAVSAPSQQGQG